MTLSLLSRSGAPPLEVALKAAKETGKLLLARFHTDLEVTWRGRNDLVTDVDVNAQVAAISLLQEEYPDFSFLAEESAERKLGLGYTWVLDPLDGTRNYVWGIPFFAVSLALVKGEDILLGVVYDPVRDEAFTAEKSQGARLNGFPLAVSRKGQLRTSLIGFDIGYDDERGRQALHHASSLWPGVLSVRVMGSAALGLAYAAAGRLDLYFHYHLNPWDLAAGVLLVTEAGGLVSDPEGRPLSLWSQGVVAANPALHQEFLEHLKRQKRQDI